MFSPEQNFFFTLCYEIPVNKLNSANNLFSFNFSGERQPNISFNILFLGKPSKNPKTSIYEENKNKIMLYRPIENERENVYSKFLLMKSSKKCFIFSSACYLIIWLLISPFFFEKRCFENMTAGFPLSCQNPLR